RADQQMERYLQQSARRGRFLQGLRSLRTSPGRAEVFGNVIFLIGAADPSSEEGKSPFLEHGQFLEQSARRGRFLQGLRSLRTSPGRAEVFGNVIFLIGAADPSSEEGKSPFLEHRQFLQQSARWGRFLQGLRSLRTSPGRAEVFGNVIFLI